MSVDYVAILAAAVGQFAFGALWYMPLFGNLWGKIHSFDKVPKAKQDEMRAKMGPYYGFQFLSSVLQMYVVARLIDLLPNYSPYSLAFLVWLGFVVPVEYGAVVFGGTEPKWIITKIAIGAFGTLGCLLVGVFILGLF